MRTTEQIYSNYTDEDFKVWNILYNRQLAFIEDKVASEFLQALDVIKFSAESIPNFNEINSIGIMLIHSRSYC